MRSAPNIKFVDVNLTRRLITTCPCSIRFRVIIILITSTVLRAIRVNAIQSFLLYYVVGAFIRNDLYDAALYGGGDFICSTSWQWRHSI